MWLLLACADPPAPEPQAPPPDLLAEMRVGAADDPRLVQCLLPRLAVRKQKAAWRAAWEAAEARGQAFATLKDYQSAVHRAVVRWGVSPPEAAGSRAEQNRLLCTAGLGIRSEQVAERLAAAGETDRADLRLLLLAATGEVPWPDTPMGRFATMYQPCWEGVRDEGERVQPGAADLVGQTARVYTTPPDWETTRDAIALLGDLPGFFAAGRPVWEGLEGVYVADVAGTSLVLAGGTARCQLSPGDTVAEDLVAWRRQPEGWFLRVSLGPSHGLGEAAIHAVRTDGDSLVVDTATGSTRYWLAEDRGGCVPSGDEPRWYLSPRPPEDRRMRLP